MSALVWALAGLVWLGLAALVVAMNHSAHRGGGAHPRPEAPSIGEDPTDDEDRWTDDDEKQHRAWLDEREPPA